MLHPDWAGAECERRAGKAVNDKAGEKGHYKIQRFHQEPSERGEVQVHERLYDLIGPALHFFLCRSILTA